MNILESIPNFFGPFFSCVRLRILYYLTICILKIAFLLFFPQDTSLDISITWSGIPSGVIICVSDPVGVASDKAVAGLASILLKFVLQYHTG